MAIVTSLRHLCRRSELVMFWSYRLLPIWQRSFLVYAAAIQRRAYVLTCEPQISNNPKNLAPRWHFRNASLAASSKETRFLLVCFVESINRLGSHSAPDSTNLSARRNVHTRVDTPSCCPLDAVRPLLNQCQVEQMLAGFSSKPVLKR
jgi:hypothetical protein